MSEEGLVERMFMASVHKALEEIAPERLEVFEKYFDPTDRRPRFHIATLIGAVGYLRRTPALYRRVMEQAGRYASHWSSLDLSRLERKALRIRLPFLRDRVVRRLLRLGLRSIHRDGELEVKREGDRLVVTVRNSLFCRTGSAWSDEPACDFYQGLFAGLLECTEDKCSAVVESSCRGKGDTTCRFVTVP